MNRLDCRLDQSTGPEDLCDIISDENEWNALLAQPDSTEAEIEDERQIKAKRAERKQTREALVTSNPNFGYNEMFKDFWPGGYANFALPVLAVVPFQSFPFEHSNTSTSRDKRNLGRQRFCAFLSDYALMYLAKNIYTKNKRDPIKLPRPVVLPEGFIEKNPRHQAIGAAMCHMNRQGGSIGQLSAHWRQGKSALAKVSKRQARVQISLKLLGSEHADLSERDLRVLMAINSCCGEKGWNIINWKILALRAVGAMNDEIANRLGVTPMSRKQVERAFAKLLDKKLIRSYVWNRRITYVAKRGKGCLSEAEFQDLVRGHLRRKHAKQRADQEERIVKMDERGGVAFLSKEDGADWNEDEEDNW